MTSGRYAKEMVSSYGFSKIREFGSGSSLRGIKADSNDSFGSDKLAYNHA